MELLYLEDPCGCEACGGYDDSECKFSGADGIGPYLYATYVAYVEEGNTPLTELPLYYVEVGQLIRRYRNLSKARQINEQREKEKQREMLRKAGVL